MGQWEVVTEDCSSQSAELGGAGIAGKHNSGQEIPEEKAPCMTGEKLLAAGTRQVEFEGGFF
jgi:hypothetical protein